MPTLGGHFQELLDHWRALPRGASGVPFKRDFRPARLARLLPALFLGERLSRYELQVRLIGSAFTDLAGRDLTGTNMVTSYPENERDFYADFLDAYCGLPCAGRLVRLATFSDGLVYDMETVAVPLADTGGQPMFILGVGQATVNRAKSLELRIDGGTRPWHAGQIVDFDFIDVGFGVPAEPDVAAFGHGHAAAIGAGSG